MKMRRLSLREPGKHQPYLGLGLFRSWPSLDSRRIRCFSNLEVLQIQLLLILLFLLLLYTTTPVQLAGLNLGEIVTSILTILSSGTMQENVVCLRRS